MLSLHNNLRDRVAVITGGSGILCSNIAKELFKQGMKVAIIGRNLEKAEEVVKSIDSTGESVQAFQSDVTDEESLENAKNEIIKRFGRIDTLINGAGGNNPTATTNDEKYDENNIKNFFNINTDGFAQVFDINFIGTFIAIKVFSKELLKNNHTTIINISSMSAFSPMTKVPAYSAAKASINNFTQWLAVYFSNEGLRVNSIAPGFFLTEQNQKLLINEEGNLTERSKKIINNTPMERFGKPDDLLGTVLWLVDEEYSGFVTGITVPVDGGFMAYSGV